MSYIYKCDCCGKDSAMTGVKFTPDDLEIVVDTYNGSKMNVKLNLTIEDLVDTQNIQKMESMMNGLMAQRMMGEGPMTQEGPPQEGPPQEGPIDEQMYQETMYENLDMFMKEFKDKLMFMGNTIGLKLNTPNAMICNTCKKELTFRVLKDGTFKQEASIFDFLYATDSLRIPPMPPLAEINEVEEKNESDQPPVVVVIRHGSWYELPNGKNVRRKDLPPNVIIKTDDDDKKQ